MATDTLKIIVEADAAMATRVLKDLETQANNTEGGGSKLKAKFAELRDFMQGPVRAFEMVAGAVKSIATAYDNVMMKAADFEASLSNAISVIESQGGLTAVSMKDVLAIADRLSKTTLFEDEEIIKAASIAATFKTIGRDIFPGVIEASAKLATVMDTDLNTAVKSLGLALEDPINNYSSLSRAKVKFTDDEIKMIKQLQEEGKLHEAQQILLDKVNDKLGNAAVNAANTATGSYKNLKKTIGELGESAGKIVGAFSDTKGINKVLSEQVAWGEAYALRETIKKMNKQGQEITRGYAEAYSYQLEQFINEFGEESGKIQNAKTKAAIKEAKELLKQLRNIIEESNKAINDPSLKFRIGSGTGARSSTSSWFNIGQQMGGTGSGRYTGEMTSTADSIDKAIENMREFNDETEKGNTLLTDLASVARTSFADVFSALGQDLADSEDGWKNFGKAGLSAIAAIIEAFGSQMAIMATAAWAAVFAGDLSKIPGAVAATAGAATAYTAAGAVRAIPMAEGGYIPPRPGGTLALVGEAGRGEYIVPEGKGMGGNINIYVGGSIVTEKHLMALGAMGARRAGRRF